ncbi:MAG: hypothetical protein BWY77_01327 [bacterium ADurb.Bin431]|nr:MAG: hypothetical protein BWY77_01327 [bacterium ADurb.Bin431]
MQVGDDLVIGLAAAAEITIELEIPGGEILLQGVKKVGALVFIIALRSGENVLEPIVLVLGVLRQVLLQVDLVDQIGAALEVEAAADRTALQLGNSAVKLDQIVGEAQGFIPAALGDRPAHMALKLAAGDADLNIGLAQPGQITELGDQRGLLVQQVIDLKGGQHGEYSHDNQGQHENKFENQGTLHEWKTS